MDKHGAYTITFTSDQRGLGGQHTNGPGYGLFRCEHDETRTAVEINTVQTRTPGVARKIAIKLCEMAVWELDNQ